MLHFCHTFQIIRLVFRIHNRQLSIAKNPVSFATRLECEFQAYTERSGTGYLILQYLNILNQKWGHKGHVIVVNIHCFCLFVMHFLFF